MNQIIFLDFCFDLYGIKHFPYLVVTKRTPKEVEALVEKAIKSLEENYNKLQIDEDTIFDYIDDLTEELSSEDELIFLDDVPEIEIGLRGEL